MAHRQIRPGRTTHGRDAGLAVFLIGMRVNSWRRPGAWLPVFRAMPRMLAELARRGQGAARRLGSPA